ncbi:MAG: NCS2 family permease, partial [Planctomycetes bacterium]|nr:NCS2 family permease [Planctomycetota bacterium]
GLFVDNLVQLLLLVTLCGSLCGMHGEASALLYGRVLPGVAVSVLAGNAFYSWQALRLAKRERRLDVTALPYGINTPSLLIYIFFVMAPVYRETGNPEAAWKMGLLACLGSGIIELLGAFFADALRRHTPRAALLSTLAGIAIGFISMTFLLQIWSTPLVALVPTAIVLITYFSGIRFPLGMPGGLLAVVAGTVLAWLLPDAWTGRGMSLLAVRDAWTQAGFHLPRWTGGALMDVLSLPSEQWVRFLSVIVPMGLFTLIGSLQNLESAEAAGDRYDTRSSLSVNGIGSILAACFGSCFPTTLYIGHPGWKGLGARSGYSVLNGFVITVICLTGTVALVDSVIPIEAGMAIVLWIGIVITAQAFQATPRAHAPAVAVGLFPAIAAWGATLLFGAFALAEGRTIQSLIEANPAMEVSGFLCHGLIVFERGYILTCMILAAISACLIDRRFAAACGWASAAALITLLGLCHSYQLTDNAVDYLLVFSDGRDGAILYRAHGIAVGYALMATIFAALALHAHALNRRNPATDLPSDP